MYELESTFKKIRDNSFAVDNANMSKVLLLYEERIFYIGDCCVRFDKLRYFRSFLNNATVNINFSIKENFKFYDGLLRNNPHIDNVYTLDWEEIDFENYDIVFCIAYDEEPFLNFLHRKYGEAIRNNEFKLAVFSISALLLKPVALNNYIFPVNERLISYVKVPRPGELYITPEEQAWGYDWLKSKGMEDNEELFIICDSASEKHKLLNIAVYFKLLETLLSRRNIKVLIFDEKGMGKAEFYRGWLGDKYAKKLIFSEGLALREDLCIIGSKQTKMIFGPCTGLMHCSSGIYNNYVNNGMFVGKVPLMITYTGQYFGENKNANFWWGNCPLINCLLLKGNKNKKELVLLNSMPEQEKDLNNSLPCSEYTAELLIEFINTKLSLN